MIDPVRVTDAGQYQVAVDYGCGQLRSAPATLAITGDWLRITFATNRIVVTWDSPDMLLQSASQVNGEWTRSALPQARTSSRSLSRSNSSG